MNLARFSAREAREIGPYSPSESGKYGVMETTISSGVGGGDVKRCTTKSRRVGSDNKSNVDRAGITLASRPFCYIKHINPVGWLPSIIIEQPPSAVFLLAQRGRAQKGLP